MKLVNIAKDITYKDVLNIIRNPTLYKINTVNKALVKLELKKRSIISV